MPVCAPPETLPRARRYRPPATPSRSPATRSPSRSSFQHLLEPVPALQPRIAGLGAQIAQRTPAVDQAEIREGLPALVAFGKSRPQQFARDRGRGQAMAAKGLRPPQA